MPRPTNETEASVPDVKNIVLVHGGFVDGSGWQGVYDLLTADGYNVSVVQNQTLSLESDVETTSNALDLRDGPAILVGHSYGGAVITEAGTHESVAGLVYITAFAPDQGESVSTLIAGFPADGPQPPILPPQEGFLFLDREKFAASFAADVPARQAAFMADSQVPVGRGSAGRRGQRSRVAQQAELVPRRERRPDDPAPGTAHDGRAAWRHDHRGPR
jgi:pimeloyl-ACP methyl ester carboxylesterase